MKKKILITGVAGFIGFSVAKKLIKKYKIIGIDNLNKYYSVKLKKDRLNLLKGKNFKFYKFNVENKKKLINIAKKHSITHIIHLAAQAGVRYSISNPDIYFKSNLAGTFSILECSKALKVKNLLIASTSSVYGNSSQKLFKEDSPADRPIQFYAATKRSTEVMAHSYSHLYQIPIICMRFFTVYGPWGRPDMAFYKFTNRIVKNKAIDVYNFGNHSRDFTYIKDVVEMIYLLLDAPPLAKKTKFNSQVTVNQSPFKILNLSAGKNVRLMDYIKEIEKNLKRKAKIRFLPLQDGDVVDTRSSTLNLKKYVKVKSTTNIKIGIKTFISWYKSYYKIF